VRLGIDIGGTKTHAVVVEDGGRPLQQVRLATGHGPSGVLASARLAAERLAAAAEIPVSGFRSVGIGVPGTVDAGSGRVSHAVNLEVEELALREELEAVLGLPVRVENDVNAAAYGAFRLLDCAPESSMAYLNLGTGLAAGLVLHGRLWRGSRGAAGEIGHIPIDPNGPLCSCGQRGCLETVASGAALSRQWPGGGTHPVQELFAAAEDGDAEAAAVRSRLVRNIASAVRLLVLTVDVDAVAIGGGISAAGDGLLSAVRSALLAQGTSSPFLSSLQLPRRVRLVPPDLPVAAVGAALVGLAEG